MTSNFLTVVVHILPDPRNPVPYGLITNPVLAGTFEMDTSGTVFLFQSLNDTLVGGSKVCFISLYLEIHPLSP